MEAMGRLAGGVAHDFNNVLTAIQGYTRLLLDDFAEDDPDSWPSGEMIRSDLGEISRSADRAAALTEQLLIFSRKQVMQPRVLDLNDLLGNLQKMLRRLIGEDIDLVTALDPHLGTIKADPGQIEQVILNLAVNARDAMPYGGRLTFETANVDIDEINLWVHSEAQAGPFVRLSVTDTGIGMSEEVKAHLFEPFFTTKEEGKGTGLGLATAYSIVHQSGGYIDVSSQVGKGTTFHILVPRVGQQAEREGNERVTEGLPGGTETILLVEDEESVREMVSRVLNQCGYVVLEAKHALDAMVLQSQHRGEIDLLLTDVIMPGMGGRDLARRMVHTRPGIQVLYMSGYTDDAIFQHGVLEPGTHLLQKPFKPIVMARKVRELLDARPPS
jgi:CheY-like chemotaxis protein